MRWRQTKLANKQYQQSPWWSLVKGWRIKQFPFDLYGYESFSKKNENPFPLHHFSCYSILHTRSWIMACKGSKRGGYCSLPISIFNQALADPYYSEKHVSRFSSTLCQICARQIHQNLVMRQRITWFKKSPVVSFVQIVYQSCTHRISGRSSTWGSQTV